MKHVSANKLNRLWQNGVIPKLLSKIDKTRVLTTMEQVTANTDDENIASAVVISQINDNLGGLSFYEDEDGNKYVVGADSVPKKLGSAGKIAVAVRLGSGYAKPTNENYPRANISYNTVTLTIDLETLSVTKSGTARVWCYDYEGSTGAVLSGNVEIDVGATVTIIE